MGCACGGSTKSEYIVTNPDGSTVTVSGETQARIEATKTGGTFKKK